MIRIVRPAAVPPVLVERGAARVQEHESHLGAGSAEPLAFDRDTYAHASVKRALVAMQHEKCAFCEAKPLHVSDGDVEHFRPKAAVRQSDADPLESPGYYWLAYEWTNLLFSCERCNRRHKRSLFPLLDPSQRVRSRAVPLTAEAPVFVDPAAEDPAQLLSFREHVPIALDGNDRGEHTIEALGLRRRELNDDREKHLEQLKAMHALAALDRVPADLRARARAWLLRAVAPEAEYSLMCRIALAALGGVPPAPEPAFGVSAPAR